MTPPRATSPRRLLLVGALGAALGAVGYAATAPERVLQAEFARQRWLAGADRLELDIAGRLERHAGGFVSLSMMD